MLGFIHGFVQLRSRTAVTHVDISGQQHDRRGVTDICAFGQQIPISESVSILAEEA